MRRKRNVKYYCWNCRKMLPRSEVKVTRSEYVCKVCLSSAVDLADIVKPLQPSSKDRKEEEELSRVIRERLRKLGLLDKTDHLDRLEIGREIERRTGLYCNDGVQLLSDRELREIVRTILKREKRKPVETMVV